MDVILTAIGIDQQRLILMSSDYAFWFAYEPNG